MFELSSLQLKQQHIEYRLVTQLPTWMSMNIVKKKSVWISFKKIYHHFEHVLHVWPIHFLAWAKLCECKISTVKGDTKESLQYGQNLNCIGTFLEHLKFQQFESDRPASLGLAFAKHLFLEGCGVAAMVTAKVKWLIWCFNA